VTECAFWQRKRHPKLRTQFVVFASTSDELFKDKNKGDTKIKYFLCYQVSSGTVYTEICKHCKNYNREIIEISWRHNIFQNPVYDEMVEKCACLFNGGKMF
jgi:hypothetical protein